MKVGGFLFQLVSKPVNFYFDRSGSAKKSGQLLSGQIKSGQLNVKKVLTKF